MLDSPLVDRIGVRRYHHHKQEDFMFKTLMDLVPIVADKGTGGR